MTRGDGLGLENWLLGTDKKVAGLLKNKYGEQIITSGKASIENMVKDKCKNPSECIKKLAINMHGFIESGGFFADQSEPGNNSWTLPDDAKEFAALFKDSEGKSKFCPDCQINLMVCYGCAPPLNQEGDSDKRRFEIAAGLKNNKKLDNFAKWLASETGCKVIGSKGVIDMGDQYHKGTFAYTNLNGQNLTQYNPDGSEEQIAKSQSGEGDFPNAN